MFLKKIGIFGCLLMVSLIAFGQNFNRNTEYITQKFPNKIFMEIGGQAGLFSMNYERFYPSNSKVNYSLRLGLGYSGEFIVPIGFNVNQILKEYHQFSAGPAMTLFVDYNDSPFINSVFDRFLRDSGLNFGGNLGYHYSNDGTDLSIGFVVTPLIDFFNFRTPTFRITAGLRVGYHF